MIGQLQKLPAKAWATARHASILQRCLSTGPDLEADVVVVGGGMVGSSLTAALAQDPAFAQKKICLLEGGPAKTPVKTPVDHNPGEFSNRVSALNPQTVAFLRRLGAWPKVEASGRFRPFTKMYVWDECSPSSIEFQGKMDPENEDGTIACMVENDVTVDSLAATLGEIKEAFGNVQVWHQARIAQCSLPDDDACPSLTLEDGRTVRGQLLVGADGANSVVRKAMGGHYFSKDYLQMGVVGTITFEEEFDNDTAYQKFMKTGPIALLPLDRNRSSLVWTVSRNMVKPLKELNPEEFASKLNAALITQSSNPFIEGVNVAVGSFLRSLRSRPVTSRLSPPLIARVDNVAAFPLGTGLPERAVSSKGTVLVGDAFHRVHPLAGQGVNLGFGDAECLVKTLSAGMMMGRHLGDYQTLCNYETERLRHNIPTMAAIDGLQQLYCTDNPLFVLARSVGLQLVNSNDTLKRLAMSQASH